MSANVSWIESEEIYIYIMPKKNDFCQISLFEMKLLKIFNYSSSLTTKQEIVEVYPYISK